jgi:hypothetical protein
MARLGINPARGKVTSYRPARVSVAMLTYIPHLSGYFEGRLQVLQLVLASLKAHTPPPFDLIVFDNDSCQPCVNTLRQMQQDGLINYLMLSEKNIGKIGALHILFNAAPGEIIAYNDDDILFYPGWLEAQLEILDLFPGAGMVSGVPVRNAAGHARQSLDRLASQAYPGLTTSLERRIPDAWEADWALSTGRDPQAHLLATRDQLDLVLRMQKPGQSTVCEAIGSANHFQFVAPKEIILKALPAQWSGKLMGSMIEMDEAIDAQGCLRLSTVDRYTRHLGNVLSQEVLDEAQSLGLSASAGLTASAGLRASAGLPAASRNPVKNLRKPSHKHWLLRIPGSRRLLTAVYNRLFEILHHL